ncbi:MAG: NAD(P) transhydrogenase subunit alpha [Saprospiraceae bacterium]|nr:NAD(P) transhydrogenase subunit alpha [Saprospiraceae bacterium]MBK8636380.1 NAD(P) transhydrogenase subunit alpha [Saprospiraceae bacterium]HMS70465.1 NAD(P) transhydrogenase subunit alpha [Saprospiraceae bacterium]
MIAFIQENLIMAYLLVFTVVLGFELISKVPTVLHTPLMSGANAISGIVVIGAIFLLRTNDSGDIIKMLIGSAAIILAMINIVGGFAVTNRMLSMFNKKKKD